MMIYPERSCPTCNMVTQHGHVISSIPQAESLDMEQMASVWSGFFKKKAFFSYHRCHQCGLLFCPQFFSDQQLADLYASMADNTAGVSIEPLMKTQKAYFASLKKYLPVSREGFLEFGPDIGLFTRCCVENKLFKDYWLIEPNQKVWPNLQTVMGNESMHLGKDNELIERIPDGGISVVAMIHVLDHLLDPTALLQRLRPKLTPDAIIFFVTHDEHSLMPKVIKAKWPPYCLQHPQLYNKETISSLLGNVGMSVMSCEKTRNYFPVTYLIKHALFLLGINNFPLPAWNALQIGLRLGNILTVAKLK